MVPPLFEENRGIIFLFMGCLMIPNVLAQLILVLRKRNPAPYWSFYFSLLINCGYGCLLGLAFDPNYKYFIGIGGVLIGITVICTILPCSKQWCGTSFDGNHFVIRELWSGIQTSTDFHDTVRINRETPPEIKVFAEASHTEITHHTRTTKDSQGRTHREHYTREREVVTWRDSKQLEYSSWEEDGDPIKIDNRIPVIHAAFVVKYRLDKSAKMALASLESSMETEAHRHDVHIRVWVEMKCPGLQEVVCGTALEEIPDSLDFWKSPIAIALWVVCFLLGYQSLFECFWCSMGDRMRMTLKKRISMENQFRCKRGEHDRLAAEESFRLFDTVVPLIGPSNEVYTPYPPQPCPYPAAAYPPGYPVVPPAAAYPPGCPGVPPAMDSPGYAVVPPAMDFPEVVPRGVNLPEVASADESPEVVARGVNLPEVASAEESPEVVASAEESPEVVAPAEESPEVVAPADESPEVAPAEESPEVVAPAEEDD